MSEIVEISRPWARSNWRADVVFVHGIGGSPETTWADSDGISWCNWLDTTFGNVRISALRYEASPSAWFGHTMPLELRAVNVNALLRSRGFGQRPLIFVAHSMGGLLVKEMLRNAKTTATHEYGIIAKATKGILFLSTPHSGSHLADLLLTLITKLIAKWTPSVDELRSNAAHLIALNQWYRNCVHQRTLKTAVLYETLPTKGYLVVDPGSSDPGIRGVTPVPVDADHFSIASASAPSCGKFVFDYATQFIAETLAKYEAPEDLGRAANRSVKMSLRSAASSDDFKRIRTEIEQYQQKYPEDADWLALLKSIERSIQRAGMITEGPIGRDGLPLGVLTPPADGR